MFQSSSLVRRCTLVATFQGQDFADTWPMQLLDVLETQTQQAVHHREVMGELALLVGSIGSIEFCSVSTEGNTVAGRS